jgi:hypothetical protein
MTTQSGRNVGSGGGGGGAVFCSFATPNLSFWKLMPLSDGRTKSRALPVFDRGFALDRSKSYVLLETNEGLRSRFATRIEFDSYCPEEILAIANVIARGNDSELSSDAAENLLQAAKLLDQRTVRGKPAIDIAGNGRYARQLVEAAEQYRDIRLTRSENFEDLDAQRLGEISAEDMTEAIDSVHARLNVSD